MNTEINYSLLLKRQFRAKTGLSPRWFEAMYIIVTVAQSLFDDITDYI